MTLLMTVTIAIVPTLAALVGDILEMSKILGVMKLKITEIIMKEQRPFTIADLKEFEVGDKKYQIGYGTAKNNISTLMKAGFLKRAFRSRPAFYTIPGKEFDKTMTLDRMGVPAAVIDQSLLKATPIYNWLKNQPVEKQSLHNIRLRFESPGLWHVFSKVQPALVNPDNKDIMLPSSVYCDYLDVTVTIHHSDTVSIAISCSFRPIAVDIPDILTLYETLIRTEISLAGIVENYSSNNDSRPVMTIPRYTKWIVTMWHFGVDTINEYSGKEFEVTFGEGVSDLYRIYTKPLKKDGKNKVRAERQEYPNQKYADAIVRKLFPNGRLVGPDELAPDRRSDV
jgi:hypothetical protein